jgi:hypothetical protein
LHGLDGESREGEEEGTSGIACLQAGSLKNELIHNLAAHADIPCVNFPLSLFKA